MAALRGAAGAAAPRQKHFLYEANVGAGLPVMSTLHDLIASGDEIVKIEGILSGHAELSVQHLRRQRAVQRARGGGAELGFTEPDPREDLSGEDVARKLLILAREIGLQMDIEEVQRREPRAAAARPRRVLARDSSRRLRDTTPTCGSGCRRRRRAATCCATSASSRRGRRRPSLREYPRDHPLAAAKGSDNIIAFTTKRYSRTPLVVQGPGAGADVTAMGVFSDILKLLHYLPT